MHRLFQSTFFLRERRRSFQRWALTGWGQFIMATEENETDAAKASGSKMGIVLWLVMIIVAVGGGVASPILVAQMGSAEKPEATESASAYPG